MYVQDDDMHEATGYALLLLTQVFWFYRWRNRCEKCAANAFGPIKNTESMDGAF